MTSPDTHTLGRWATALSSDDAAARAARSELATAWWYPVYAFFRAGEADGESAASLTETILSKLIEEPVRDTPLLREWMLGLAQGALADPAPREALLTIDREWAAQRFATEGAHAPEETFVRRWTLDLLEQAITALEAEYVAAGKGHIFAAAQSFLGYSGGSEGSEPYAELAATLGVSDGAGRKMVFELRKRYREVLRAALADTVATEEQIASELQALLVKLPAPAETVVPHPVLRRLDPEQLLARGMNSVQMSTAGGMGWTPPTVAEAARLFPGYEVVGMLGHGGMGAVYQARQQSLDRLVALKLLPLEISVDPSFADRFRREARAMAKLNHPNIISVHDFGQTSEGHLFFAMEFVEGSMLHDLVHKREGGLPPADALAIIEQVCEALSYAHEQGIVHRDIKPANVMIDARGRAKIADFGLARLSDPATAEQWGQTMTGIIMGTPDYMSPEQKRGMHVDHRADIYSVGVMFYEMLCGETPQGALELPSQRCGLPKELDAVITRAIAPQPEKRFQTTAEFKQAVVTVKPSVLKAAAKKSHTIARKPGAAPVVPIATAAPDAARNPLILWGSIAAAVVVLGAVGAFVFGKGKSKPAPITSTQHEAEATKPADKPKTAASKPPAASPAPALKPSEPNPAPAPALVAAGNEKWVDGLAQWFGGAKTNDAFVRENNGGARIGLGSATLSPIPRSARFFKDQVARVRWHPSDASSSLEVHLRHAVPAAAAGDQGFAYHASLKQKESWTVRLACRVPGKPYYGLQDPKLPADFKFDATHTLEFRVVGDLLTVSVDGKKVGEHRDSQLKDGHPAITAKNVVIESFEYANLDPAAPAPAVAAAKPATTTSASSPAQPGDVLIFGGHRYQFHKGPFIKAEAQALAASLGGHLVTITTPAEQAWIEASFEELIRGSKNGLCRAGAEQGTAAWTTGEPWEFTNWDKDQPKGTNDYLVLSHRSGKCPWQTTFWSQASSAIVEWDDDGTAKPATAASPQPASTTNAPAATIAPAFENTLGMKFVPVPITGGPTNGQRVLFSIWETRVQDYQVFADETKREWPKPEPGQGATHPAVNVRWEDAQAFCAWLTERERKAGKLGAADSYRLPSDHEWSCAVGIGEQEDAAKLPDAKAKNLPAVFPWGSAWPPPVGAGNYAGDEMQAAVAAGKYPRVKEVLTGYRDEFVDKSPVGSFAPNRFGLYDLSGNVSEWCEDWFSQKKDAHSFRGASFSMSKAEALASTSRVASGTRYADVGFRAVLMPGAGSLVGTVAASAPKAEAAPTPPTPAPAKTESEMEKWLAQVDGPQQESYQRDVVKPFEAGLAELQKSYVTALESRIAAASTAGQLDVALGWRNELQRFRDGAQSVPAEDTDLATVAAPFVAKALPPLRTQFRTQKAKLEADRFARAKVAFAKYDAVLSPNITLLTQRQRLDDALLLKTKRDEVQKAWLPTAEAPVAPAPGSPSTPAPKPLGSGTIATPPPAANSKAATNAALRAAAEWVIANGGQVEVPGKKITKPEEIPAGPLAVQAVTFKLKDAVPTDAELHALTALGGASNVKVADWNAPDSTLTFLQAFGNVGLLQFVGCPQLTDAMCEALPAMPNLGRIVFSDCPGITGTGLANLKAPKLNEIAMTRSATTDAGLAAISRHEGVKTLDVYGPAVTDAGVAHLERLRGLTHLMLHGTAVTPAGLTFLAKRKEFTNLEYLDASAPGFAENAQAIAKIVPHLTILTVSGKVSGPEATRALFGFKNLHVLQWVGSEMSDATFGELAALTDLEDLTCKGAHLTDAAMDSVLALKKLTVLALSDNPELTDAGLLKLKPLKKLKAVYFSRSKVTDAGAAELEKAIPGCKVFH